MKKPCLPFLRSHLRFVFGGQAAYGRHALCLRWTGRLRQACATPTEARGRQARMLIVQKNQRSKYIKGLALLYLVNVIDQNKPCQRTNKPLKG